MNFNSQHTHSREPRYPFLGLFDLTLNFLLCCGVFTFACAMMGIILSNSASTLTNRMTQVAFHIFN